MTTLQERISRLDDSVLISFQRGFWTASAKFDKNKLGEDVPKEIVRATQDLLTDKTLIDDIITIQNKAKYFLRNHSLPFPIDGVFRVPQNKIVYIEEELENNYLVEHDNRVDKLAKAIGKLQARFKKKYPKEYKPEKYPSAREIRQKFYIRWTPFTIAIPEQGLSVFDTPQYKRQIARIKDMLDEMEELAVTTIGNDLLKRLDNLHEKCQNGGSSLHGKTVGSINRFIDKWDDLWKGHVDDKKLTMIVGRLRKQMSKVSIDRLRDNDHFRQEVSSKVSAIMGKLEKLPNVELKRKIDI